MLKYDKSIFSFLANQVWSSLALATDKEKKTETYPDNMYNKQRTRPTGF